LIGTKMVLEKHADGSNDAEKHRIGDKISGKQCDKRDKNVLTMDINKLKTRYKPLKIRDL